MASARYAISLVCFAAIASLRSKRDASASPAKGPSTYSPALFFCFSSQCLCASVVNPPPPHTHTAAPSRFSQHHGLANHLAGGELVEAQVDLFKGNRRGLQQVDGQETGLVHRNETGHVATRHG